MPKVKSSKRIDLISFIDEFGKDIFSTGGIVLFYKICKVRIAVNRKFTY